MNGPNDSRPATLLVVEDHDDLRDVLLEALEAIDGVTVAGSARSAREALDMLASRPFDVALIDMSLPDMSGDELITHLREQAPMTRCLVLSGHREPVYVARALAAGALGYVLKGDPRELAESLRSIVTGHSYVSPILGDTSTG